MSERKQADAPGSWRGISVKVLILFPKGVILHTTATRLSAAEHQCRTFDRPHKVRPSRYIHFFLDRAAAVSGCRPDLFSVNATSSIVHRNGQEARASGKAILIAWGVHRSKRSRIRFLALGMHFSASALQLLANKGC